MNPETGSFISLDTYQGNAYDPASLHKYNYAQNNPQMYKDPSGHSAMSIGEAVSCMTISSIVAVTYINIAKSLQNRVGHVSVKGLVTGKNILDEFGNLIIDLASKMQKDLIQIFPRVLQLYSMIEVIPRSVIKFKDSVFLKVGEWKIWVIIEPEKVLRDLAKEAEKSANRGKPISEDDAKTLDEWADEYGVPQHHKAYPGSGKHFKAKIIQIIRIFIIFMYLISKVEDKMKKLYNNGYIIQKKSRFDSYKGIEGDNWYLNYCSDNSYFEEFYEKNIDKSWNDVQYVDCCVNIEYMKDYIEESIKKGIDFNIFLCSTYKEKPLLGDAKLGKLGNVLGYDYAYTGGSYYSCILNDIVSERIRDFEKFKLNKNGLFNTYEEAEEFSIFREKIKSIGSENDLEEGDFVIYKITEVII